MTRFIVNGQPVDYLMDPATPQLRALCDASSLTVTGYGCGVGDRTVTRRRSAEFSKLNPQSAAAA